MRRFDAARDVQVKAEVQTVEKPGQDLANDKHRNALRVLVVDDSPSLCQFLERALSRDPDLLVVGVAHDAFEARELIKTLRPDVLTLDVGMPGMDGLTFLGNLMRLRPMPVVVLSALTAGNDEIARAALDKGAIEVVAKPTAEGTSNFTQFTDHLINTVKRSMKPERSPSPAGRKSSDSGSSVSQLPDFDLLGKQVHRMSRASPSLKRVIALGASTGGPEALRTVLSSLDVAECALVLAQHMPERFMEPFAQRLDAISSFCIRIAREGDRVQPGNGYVAPGDCHLTVVREGDHLVCRLLDSAPISGHRPSVDALFASVAEAAGASTLAALLTGMGCDGAKGLLDLHRKGALTIAQDERTSIVWGMPGKAVALGGVTRQLAVEQIGPLMTELIKH